MMCVLATAGALGAGGCAHTAATPEPVLTQSVQTAITPDAALDKLMAGNARFVAGKPLMRDYPDQVKATANGQYPYAVVLSCIDSRTSPELVFDEGLGDIFAPRVAGNFVNADILGSMEFATAVAGSKLIVVLGHTQCGGVKAAADHIRMGNITSLAEAIEPAAADVKEVTGERNSKNKHYVDDLAAANVRRTVANIRTKSPIIADLEKQGKVKIVGGMYELSTGKVTILN